MNTEILRDAENKKFTEFSNAVKAELKQKLASRPEVQTYMSSYDKIQQMKAAFSKINTDFGDASDSED